MKHAIPTILATFLAGMAAIFATPDIHRRRFTHRAQTLLHRLQKRRCIAFNDRPAADVAITLDVNAIAINDDSAETWHRLSPWGIYAHELGRQNVSADTVKAMVTAFNEERSKRGDNWRGVPVYLGHPDHPSAPKGTVKKKIGSIMALDVRDDGIYAQTAWNSAGRNNITEGEAPYPSPVWKLSDGPNGTKIPVRLLSVGMVPNPNIVDADAWTNEITDAAAKEEIAEAKDPAIALNEAITIITEGGCLGMNKEETRTLRESLWLPEDSTIEQVKAALAMRMAEINEQKARIGAMEADYNALQQKLNDEQAKATATNEAVTTAREAARDALLDLAINEARISLGERAAYVTAFNDDFAGTAAKLKELKPRMNLRRAVVDPLAHHESLRTAESARTAFNEKVKERMEKTKKPYQVAFNEAYEDPENAGLVAAMTGRTVAPAKR